MSDNKLPEKAPEKCLWRGKDATACQQDKWHEGEHDPESYSKDPKERRQEIDRELKHRVTLGWRHDVEPSKERKARSRERAREREEFISETHIELTEAGIPKRAEGGKLGLRKRARMAKALEGK
jgi:hypothetical protein